MVRGRMGKIARGEVGRGRVKEEQGKNKGECEGKQWERSGCEGV